MDGQALFAGNLSLYASVYKDMGDSLKPNSKEARREAPMKPKQNKCRNRDNRSEDKGSTREKKNPLPNYQKEPRPVETSNFFASLSDIPMQNEQPGCEGGSNVTSRTGVDLSEGRPPSPSC
jgi:hypothetical protein